MIVIGNSVMNWVQYSDKVKIYKQIGTYKTLISQNTIGGILLKIQNYDKSFDAGYVGEVVLFVAGLEVSRETFINGMASFDLSDSEIGIYDLIIKSNGLNDCVVTYEKN